MFIRKTTRRYKDKTYTNYLLAESVRTEKGPGQKTICSLGDLSARPRSEWLKLARRVEQALAGQDDLLEPADAEVDEIASKARQARAAVPRTAAGGAGEVVAVRTADVRTEEHREAGPVHAGCALWDRLGLTAFWRTAGFLRARPN